MILVINSGSSSLKFKLFTEQLKILAEGMVEKIGQSGSFINFKIGKKDGHSSLIIINHEAALNAVLNILQSNNIDFKKIKKIGHRVVHGGDKFSKPLLLNNENIKILKQYNKLAPLHNPHNIAGIEACHKELPWAKNYAVFDTAFHTTIPDYAGLYPLPIKFFNENKIKKYGFHGISNEYVTGEAAKKLKKKKPNLIVCHLGNGCSITAIKEGKSVDTSMGFTPLEGIMMGTRTGDIDPSIVIYLEEEGFSREEVYNILNFESGLRGVSGLQDMRDIMIASGYKIAGYKSAIKFDAKKKYLAKLALNMFVYRIKKYIGAYVAVLGKVDALIFTAGIGERNNDIRNLIVKNLPFKFKVLVVPTNEELMIAKLIN